MLYGLPSSTGPVSTWRGYELCYMPHSHVRINTTHYLIFTWRSYELCCMPHPHVRCNVTQYLILIWRGYELCGMPHPHVRFNILYYLMITCRGYDLLYPHVLSIISCLHVGVMTYAISVPSCTTHYLLEGVMTYDISLTL